MEKLIITACICGAEVTKEHNPAVPYTVEEIANEAYSAYKAGASIIHLHVRYDDGTPTQDKACLLYTSLCLAFVELLSLFHFCSSFSVSVCLVCYFCCLRFAVRFRGRSGTVFLKVPFAPQSPKKSLIAASLRAAAIFVYC